MKLILAMFAGLGLMYIGAMAGLPYPVCTCMFLLGVAVFTDV